MRNQQLAFFVLILVAMLAMAGWKIMTPEQSTPVPTREVLSITDLEAARMDLATEKLNRITDQLAALQRLYSELYNKDAAPLQKQQQQQAQAGFLTEQEIRKAHGWNADVKFDPATRTFYREPAPKPAEKK